MSGRTIAIVGLVAVCTVLCSNEAAAQRQGRGAGPRLEDQDIRPLPPLPPDERLGRGRMGVHSPGRNGLGGALLMPDDVKGRLGGQDMQGLIRAVRMVLMTRELSLTEEQAARITAIESEQEESTRDLTQRRQEAFRRLRSMVKDESFSPQSVDESMEELDRIADELHGLSRDSERRILDLLEPEQKVKLIIFKQRFRRDLMTMVERVRRMVQQGNGPPPDELLRRLRGRGLGRQEVRPPRPQLPPPLPDGPREPSLPSPLPPGASGSPR